MPKGVYSIAGRRKVWAPEEGLLVEEWIAQGRSTAEIAHRLGRSTNSVEVWLKRNVKRRAVRPMTAHRVAALLGLRCPKTITRWIAQGWLRARRGHAAGPNRVWVVSEDALFAFLEDRAHWHRWEVESITDRDVREWAAEKRAGVRFLTQAEVAQRFHVVTPTVSDWIDRGLLASVDTGSHRMVEESSLADFLMPSEISRAGKPRQPFTPVEDARLLALRAGGASWSEIAYQMRRPLGSCAGRWTRLHARRRGAVAA